MEAIGVARGQVVVPGQQGVQSQGAVSMVPRESFAAVIERVFAASEIGSGFNNRLTGIQSRVISGSNFSPRELLMLQMQMGRFNMQVELVSKVAESATATLRKLQNG